MNSRELYKRLLTYVWPYKKIFILAILMTVLVAATEPAVPAMMQKLLDGSFIEQDPQSMFWMPILLVAVFLFKGIVTYIGSIAMRYVSNQVVMDLRDEMFSKLQLLPMAYFDDHASGQTISKLTYDVTRVMNATTNVLVVILRDSFTIIFLVALMLYINWKLSLISFFILPPTMLVISFISKRLRKLSRNIQKIMGDLTTIIQESVLGSKIVKIFNGTEYENKRFSKVNKRFRQYNMKLAYAGELNAPLVQLFAVIALAVIVYFATDMATRDEMSAGEFMALFTAMGLMFSPIKRLTKVNEKLQLGLAAAESIFGLLDQKPENNTGQQLINNARGKLSFNNTSFSYDGETQIINNVKLEIKAGTKVALVGKSGSGKTTLAHLVPRLYEMTSGCIELDDIDIRELELSNLREQIAYVGQDTVLFDDTIAANIAYGLSTDVSDESIIDAAAKANALEFIEQLEDGMQTIIGENGLLLSGGQRQRISIARALLKDAPILILDEATSALDTHSEREIQMAVEALGENRTSLIIAHRLSTIENADIIVVMDKGNIVEQGSHSELLNKKGVYASLHQLQTGGVM